MKFGINVGLVALGYGLLRFAGVPIETFLALALAIAIGWPLGWFIGTLIGDETDVDNGLFKAIGWANLVAWIIPFAGIAVAKLTSSVGKESIKSRLFYDTMSIAGYALVIVSVLFLVPWMMSERSQSGHSYAASMPRYPDHVASSERSFARCPYAIIENWTAEEVQINCKHKPSEEEIRAFELEQQRARTSEG
ncbi:MAG: hypothetical protein IE933_08530 [Sphingomonadales bacterium]|nr:hypothetical protein [Sphingomonadales bacterium]MBD3773596.1 hypothetical protein [Paracoccaceae bacterium]